MKAKLINEFHKTGDIKSSLGIAGYKEVKEKLEEMFSGDEWTRKIYDFKIKNLNHIEVFYTRDFLDSLSDNEIIKNENKKWILKVVESPKYISDTRDGNWKFQGVNVGDNYLSIYKIYPKFSTYFSRSDWNAFRREHVFDIGKANSSEVREMANIIEESFLNNYGWVWSFDFLSDKKQDETS